MRLPFSPEQFLDLFERYHDAIGAAPLALTATAIIAVFLVWKGTPRASAAMTALVALLWLWSGVVYHWLFFAAVNPAARAFGALFVAQAILIVWYARRRGGLRFVSGRDPAGTAGGTVMCFALALYPVLGGLAGHGYPVGPSFGTPCPTTLFTLGALLWIRPVVPVPLLVIPVTWAAIGTTAALRLGIVEDLGLALVALVAIGVAWWQRAQHLPLSPRPTAHS